MSTFRPLPWRFLRLLWILLGALPLAPLQAQTPQDSARAIQVFLTAPAVATQPSSGPLKLEAVAIDPVGGPITEVEFLADGQVIARSDRRGDLFITVIGLKVLHQAVWESPTPGLHVLEARAVQNLKTLATSAPIRVIIGTGILPTPVDPPVIPIIPPNLPSVDLNVLDPMAMESDPKDLMTLEFRRTGDVSKPLRVYFKIGGSADWNTDFTVIPGGLKSEPVSDPNLGLWVQSVVIPAGSAVGKLPLAPIPDDKVEGDEVLYLSVIPKPETVNDGTEPSDYQPGIQPPARVMIRDSIPPAPADAPTIRILAVQSTTAEPNPFIRIIPGRIVLQRIGNPAEPVRIRYAVGGSARNGEDFSLLDGDLTLGAGETEAELLIGALEDDLKEPEETVVIKLMDDPSYRLDSSSAWAQVTIFDSTVSTKALLKWVAPSTGERLRIGSECTLKLMAVDPNGSLPTVSFWANGKPIGESQIQFFRAPDPGTPIEHNLVWKIDSEGPIRLEATAVDASGNTVASAAVFILGLPATDPIERSVLPADNAPADGVLSDMEWLIYAKYWRYGVPLPPQATPVPVGHLSRAGFLWRSGGAYRYDASVGSFPMGWVPLEGSAGNSGNAGPLPPLSGLDGILGTNGTPDRSPTSYILGEWTAESADSVTLKIYLGPAANTRCQAAEIFVGRNAVVTAISYDGQFDPKTGILRWGPFLDDTLRGLKASVSRANALEFSGLGSFDGIDQKMVFHALKSIANGPAWISAPRLTAIPASAQGDTRLVLLGAANGSAMDLEVSEDMVQWRRIGTMLGNGESQLQVDTDAGASTRRFYRVIPRQR
ncbi:MAG: hypothetical protein EXS21_07525 [Pedosphaera sp.]|nr:hypothetical protein [Pedosphaera sp.]